MRKIPIGEWEGIEYQVVDEDEPEFNSCTGCIGLHKDCRSLAFKLYCGGGIIAKRHVTIAEYKAYKEGLNESI